MWFWAQWHVLLGQFQQQPQLCPLHAWCVFVWTWTWMWTWMWMHDTKYIVHSSHNFCRNITCIHVFFRIYRYIHFGANLKQKLYRGGSSVFAYLIGYKYSAGPPRLVFTLTSRAALPPASWTHWMGDAAEVDTWSWCTHRCLRICACRENTWGCNILIFRIFKKILEICFDLLSSFN